MTFSVSQKKFTITIYIIEIHGNVTHFINYPNILTTNFTKAIFPLWNRLEENILLKETLLQTESQEHDGTKKLLKESREKNEEIMDKMKEVDKRSDRLQDNLTRFV